MAAPPGPELRIAYWYDMYKVEPAGVVICPDCDQRSPELDNVYALARWASEHYTKCPA
jgi:hypothetical protein